MANSETDEAPSPAVRTPGACEKLVTYLVILAGTALAVWGIFTPGPTHQIHILAINDVYRINGLYEGTVGGPARVRALRKKLEEEHGGPVLLFHGGDVISPSFMGRMLKGEQMIDLLNLMDGREGKFDRHMFVVFGNHEFDQDGPVLEARLRESDFTWLGSNVIFERAADGLPLVSSPNLKTSRLLTLGGIKLGIFSLTIGNSHPGYVNRFGDPLATARFLTRRLKGQGADVVIALTHLEKTTDSNILKKLCGQGLDLIIGGHEHAEMAIPVTCKATGQTNYVLKADADAASARHITISLDEAGEVTVTHELHQLKDSSPPADPDVKARAYQLTAAHDARYCKILGEKGPCLEEKIGATNILLEAEEIRIRSYETNFGDWVADRLLAAYPGGFDIENSVKSICDSAPRVAFINSGSLRLNQNINRGKANNFRIKLRYLEELFLFDNKIVLIKITGEDLVEVAENAASGWPGNGRWLQVAGFGFTHDTTGNLSELSLLDADGKPSATELAKVAVICAVTSEYLVNPGFGDQDGYGMLNMTQVLNGLKDRTVGAERFPKRTRETIRAAFEATRTDPIKKADIKTGRTFCRDPKGAKDVCKNDHSD